MSVIKKLSTIQGCPFRGVPHPNGLETINESEIYHNFAKNTVGSKTFQREKSSQNSCSFCTVA